MEFVNRHVVFCVFQALLFPALLGKHLPEEQVGVTAATYQACLSWRLTSFPAGWAGLPPLEMGLCGLYLNDKGTVKSGACAYFKTDQTCQVIFFMCFCFVCLFAGFFVCLLLLVVLFLFFVVLLFLFLCCCLFIYL